MVGQHAVDFLGHGPIEAPHSGLDMDDGNVQFGGGQGPRERGVGVAIDDHGVEPAARKAFLDGSQHPAGLHAMPARADVQVHVGVAEVQIAKELAAHVVVVMLAGMYQGLDVAPLAEFAAERRRLHELRPCANERIS